MARFAATVTSNAMLNVVLNNFGLKGSGSVANSAQLWSQSYGSSMLSIGGVTLPLNLLVAVNGAYSLVGLWWAHATFNNHIVPVVYRANVAC